MRTQTQILGKVSITVDKYYHNYINEYERLTIVSERGTGIAYISRKDVPSNIYLNDREYWIPLGYPANLDTEAIAQINNIIDELIVSKADASDLELYAKKEDISDMATKTEVASCAKLADIVNMATKTELELKADKADLNLKVDLDTYNKFKNLLYKEEILEEVTAKREHELYKLVLNITNKCNLACKYCYANGGNYCSSEGIMKVETAKATLDTFLKRYRNIRVIQFFGGEPTFNLDVIEFVCK